MEWYIPITILPGIALLILSTSNLLIALNNEIRDLNKDKTKYEKIINQKLVQLKLLNYALIGEYLSAFLLVVAGVLGELLDDEMLTVYLVIVGVIFLTFSISLLIRYSLRSVAIRQEHLRY